MEFNRRRFICSSGFIAGSLTVAPKIFASAKDQRHQYRPIDSAGSSWQGIRDQFLLDPSLIHMAGLLLASNPTNVRNAIERHRQGLDKNPVEYFGSQWAQAEKDCYETAAAYLNTAPEQVALTDSTTMGLGLLYTGLILKNGQEILTTEHDHYATKSSLKTKAESSGAVVRQISLYEQSHEASEDEIVRRIAAAITEKTRVLAITWVHSGTGVKLPLRKIADVVDGVNSTRAEEDAVLFCVDGVHGFGIENIEIESIGCDFFVAGCHKWLFGPRGTGIIWGKKQCWKYVRPIIPSFNASFYQSEGSLMTPGGFHSFELRWALPEAFKFHLEIGKPNVMNRIHSLNSALKVGLAGIAGVKLHTPLSPNLSSGIVCFEVDGIAPKDVVARLRSRDIIASTTPYDVSYARLTPGLLNSERDIELAVDAVTSMSRKS